HFFFSSRRRHTRCYRDWSSDVCSSDLPQTENVFVMFKDGWHPAETPPDNAAVEWQWTKKEATLSVRNPKKDVVFYLHLDQPGVRSEERRVGEELTYRVRCDE